MTDDQRQQIADQLSRSMLSIIGELQTMNEAILQIQRGTQTINTTDTPNSTVTI